MGWLYLDQDRGMCIWAGCVYVRIRVLGYGLTVSRSGYTNEDMGWLYLGRDGCVRVWDDSI
jgi:hypothetical protein